MKRDGGGRERERWRKEHKEGEDMMYVLWFHYIYLVVIGFANFV